MASSTPLHVCGRCYLKKKSKTANVWCFECNEKLCKYCRKKYHTPRHPSHNTIQIDVYEKLPKYLKKSKQICRENDERLQLFCENHKSPCCRTCFFKNHIQCPDIVKIDSILPNVDLPDVYKETTQSLNKLAKKLDKIKNDQASSKQDAEKEIEEFREKMNKYLDNIIKELNKTSETEKETINEIVDEISLMEKNVKENKEKLSFIDEYLTKLPTIEAYLAMKQIQNDIRKRNESYTCIRAKSKKFQQNTIWLSTKFNTVKEDILSQIETFLEEVRDEESLQDSTEVDDYTGTRPCNDSRCKTCEYTLETQEVKGHYNSFIIKNDFTCKSKNLVYAIVCEKCPKVYIGKTIQELHNRFSRHIYTIENNLNCAVGNHFRSPGHSLLDMQVTALLTIDGSDEDLLKIEQRLIFYLGTEGENGINKNCKLKDEDFLKTIISEYRTFDQ